MILEELIGSCVALALRLIFPSPSIRRENALTENRLIEENHEDEEEYDGFIHQEYEQQEATDAPYEDGSFVRLQDENPRRSFCESICRSFKANIRILMAVLFLLSMLTVGVVYVDLNTSDVCTEWMDKNITLPSQVRTLRKIGMAFKLVPLFAWFPICIAMLWGFNRFKKYYFLRLFVCAFLMGSATCAYRIILFDKFTNVAYNLYRLPGNLMFTSSVVFCAYLVAHKFKKVNATTSYSVLSIFFTLSFVFLASCLVAYLYTFIIIKYFRETEGKVKKAIIAALTPGIIFPVTAIAKYIALRKGAEIVPPDRAFVMCYILRGASIVLYRTMQSDFKNIWLYVSLSLLHGVSNVLSKATLNFRIKAWKAFIRFFNKTCCSPRLDVRSLKTPRIRRLNADLETQNILFEYNTIILSQAFLTFHLVLSYEVSFWDVMKDSLIRVAIGLTIDFAFNMMSVFIQIHFYNIPMHLIWMAYWRRHVIANAFMIIVHVSYFGSVFIRVFADKNDTLKLRNCTTIF